MDDLIEGLAGSVVGIVLVLALGAVIGAGWLLYKFCEIVLPPLFELLAHLCTQGWRRFATPTAPGLACTAGVKGAAPHRPAPNYPWCHARASKACSQALEALRGTKT